MRNVISEIERRLDDGSARGLALAVSRAARDGVLEPGQRLPPIREVAHQLALSPTTVSAAWHLLARAGTLHSEGRRGTFLADVDSPREGRYRQALAQRTEFAIDLSTGVPDARLLPRLNRALRHVTTAGTPQSYLDEPVLPDLHNALAASWPYPPAALTVVDGAMDALELVIRTRLTFGDRVVVEHPTFPPLLDLLQAAGIEVAGVRLDDEGIVPSALADAVALPAQALFLQPRAHNPTGISMTARRARQLAVILRRHDILVVEDDSAYAISVSPDVTLATSLPASTVHIRSFSKSYGPDLRLAALSGPEDVIAAVRQLRELGQGWSSRLLQHVLLNLLTDDATSREIATARVEYAHRRRVFVETLTRQEVSVTGTDGLNIWVTVANEAAALMRLAAQGIAVAPGKPFKVLPDDDAHVRVTTGAVHENLEQVARIVGEAARIGLGRAMAR